MKKSKKSSEEPEDRLSDLPDSLIFEIFWLLPMRDVVQTTILSKRWENLWTTTPYLNLDGNCNSEFFNQALILWRGSKILKFKFCFGSYDNKSVFSNISVWLRLAKENGVEELYLEDRDIFGNPPEDVYVVDNLHSCSSLRVLSLKGCNFEIHGNANVQWNQLKSLTIEGPFLGQNLIDKVISGSPQLEVFILNLNNLDESISIRSTSLKKLSIERFFEGETSVDSELRIWSPNLETLDIRGVPCAKYSLLNVPCLTHLSLNIFYHEFFGDDHVDEILGQIFPTVQHVERLTLSKWCTQGLVSMEEKKKDLLSPMSKIKFLTITDANVYYEDIVNLLQISPKLETLVIESIYYPEKFEVELEKHFMSCFLQGESNLPKSFLLQLRTVEITCIHEEELIFTLIEILLKYASKLQKMVIRLSRTLTRRSPMGLVLALQKLIRLPRSSPTAKLIVTQAEY